MPANTVSVARPHPHGNYAGSTRDDFEVDLAGMSNADKAFYLEQVRHDLAGKNLACWCALDAPCHADVLLELANRPGGSPEQENKMTEVIHPAPAAFTDEQLAADPILRYFHFAHLPEKLMATSVKFYELVCFMLAVVPRNAERTVALRKLLEAKDAAVRANIN